MKQIKLKILDPRIGKEFPLPAMQQLVLQDWIYVHVLIKRLVIEPGETHLIPTGIAIHIADPSLAATILPRSGLGINTELY